MAKSDDDFEEHLLAVLAGHRKRSTRLVHLLAVQWSVAALICLVSMTLGLPAMSGSLVNLVKNVREAGPQRLGLALLSSATVHGAMVLLENHVPKCQHSSDHVDRFSALLPGVQLSHDVVSKVAFYLLVFVGLGLFELASHWVFDGDAARAEAGRVTRGRAGLDKFLSVVFDVIQPAPLYFLHLALIDDGAFGPSLRWAQDLLAQLCLGGRGSFEPLASLEARLDNEHQDAEPAGPIVGGNRPVRGHNTQDDLVAPPFVWQQIPPRGGGGGGGSSSGGEGSGAESDGGAGRRRKQGVGGTNASALATTAEGTAAGHGHSSSGGGGGGDDEGVQARFETERLSAWNMINRADAFYNLMAMRRSLRFYASEQIPPGVLEKCIATAGTAPSGAHKQPWTFVVVRSPAVKAAIRTLVEAEEKVNYDKRMKRSWVRDLDTLTGAQADVRLHTADGAPSKPYLTEAPALVVVMRQVYGVDAAGNRREHYYVGESCGLATGLLISALQNVGLATLTSTPMGAEGKIRRLLQRPDNEKVFLLMPVGFPAASATVPWRAPDAQRKRLNELIVTK